MAQERPLLVCNIGYMARYRGLHEQPDKIVGGGRYVDENGWGHEACNFLPAKGKVFGMFQLRERTSLNIQRLGAASDAARIEHVDVIWTAVGDRGRCVVGYFVNATVYRDAQTHAPHPSKQHRIDRMDHYLVEARAADARCIPHEERSLLIAKGKGLPGQAGCWYPSDSESPDAARFLRQARKLLAAHGSPPVGSTPPEEAAAGPQGGGFTNNPDAENNRLVEAAATKIVERHYIAKGLHTKHVPTENKGWDLEVYEDATRRKLLYCVEIKGVTGPEANVMLTPNERSKMEEHRGGKARTYRLAIVTSARSNEHVLRVLRCASGEWLDEISGSAVKWTDRLWIYAQVSVS